MFTVYLLDVINVSFTLSEALASHQGCLCLKVHLAAIFGAGEYYMYGLSLAYQQHPFLSLITSVKICYGMDFVKFQFGQL